jgi:hypothetical protein
MEWRDEMVFFTDSFKGYTSRFAHRLFEICNFFKQRLRDLALI